MILYNQLLTGGKMIRIKRDSGYADRLRAYKVVLDDNVVGVLNNGKQFELEVTPGKHRLQLKIDWGCSNIVDFEMKDCDIEFQCGNNLKGFKILLSIFYATIFSNQCIWLRVK
jgi:hypothetical protein